MPPTMFKPLSLFIGLRYTRAKRRNHFISFISLTSVLGLTLGVAVLITVLSVMNGFDRELQTRILGMVPHATISSYEPIADWHHLGADIQRKSPQVIGIAPYSQLQGMITANGQVSGAMISGIDPVEEPKVSIVQDHMMMGGLQSLQPGEFGIVLGVGLASNLNVNVGDKITVVMPEASVSPAGVIPRFKRFTVVGIFRVGAEVDNLIAYVNISDAGRLLGIGPDHVQGVRLKFRDLFQAPEAVWHIMQDLPPDYVGGNWTQTQGNLFSAIRMEKAMMTLLLLLIVAVAAFNIVSSLVMVVTDKKADIAILRTLGASPNTIMKIFMVQGTIVGLVGTVAGTSLGVALALSVSRIASGIEHMLGINLFEAYFVNYLPSELLASDVIMVVCVAFGLSFLATIYPARKAARIQPAEALRHE